ncbi:putative Myb-like transcription factor-like protein [Calycina marina]|uniref:Myb-like transcription factor-like protein n=1 Tax=Calycina marina TaxID=1763456 RepID=A0A9P7Z562_9HELO|nr:putative Myb-like transcription factor-like protein [Calycina marina]
MSRPPIVPGSGLPLQYTNQQSVDLSDKYEVPSPSNARHKRPSDSLGDSDAFSVLGSIGSMQGSMETQKHNVASASSMGTPAKKSRTNTPWTPAEEQRLKTMRDAGNSWADIAKSFPARTEGSVKKHWYKDMHYAEFAEDESQALLNAIKEYETNKWKVIGAKVGKPAKACEQYAKENFQGRI